jgi:DNA-binding LacI/PurR family transcriptional regulator
MSVILDPHTLDTTHADEVLRELQEVLTRHGYALLLGCTARTVGRQRPHAIILAKITDLGAMKCRAVAEVQHITPRKITAEMVDWAKQELQRPS